MINSYTAQRKHPIDNVQQINPPTESGQQVSMLQNGRFLPQIQDNNSNSTSSQASSNLKRNRHPDGTNDSEQEDDSASEAAKEDLLATPSDKKTRRRKIKIEYIEDKGRRHITFSKRKAGIMKKAFELSTLTGTQVLLLVVSETGLVYTFTTPKLQPIVTKPEGKNLIQSCLNVPDTNENSLSASSDPNSSAPVQNSSSNPPPPPTSGPYINGSRQHSVSGYPENVPNVDQGPFDEDRKLSSHNGPQPIPSSNIGSDQYFSQPYYGNQVPHHLSNRNSHSLSSNGSNIYGQSSAFQPQLAGNHHGSYVGNNQAPHSTYNLTSNNSNNPSQMSGPPPHHQSSTQPSGPSISGQNSNLNFSDIVANPSIPSISGFSHQPHNNQQQHGPQNMLSQSQLYNGGYWQGQMPPQNMPPGSQPNNRASYSGSIDKI
ncbi:Transcription factor of morphogenesis MCM1 [Smittium mucronatum]|uniref:Transcription factor of morphogenesis MCM1 n=1 Tax=Smittium mucronatum TaxID=133383 RepID=A0A1R0GYZ4_9FUNG|nr:Transcription factor of morphogenesis MCM1 [Smittium mucronatum]